MLADFKSLIITFTRLYINEKSAIPLNICIIIIYHICILYLLITLSEWTSCLSEWAAQDRIILMHNIIIIIIMYQAKFNCTYSIYTSGKIHLFVFYPNQWL